MVTADFAYVRWTNDVHRHVDATPSKKNSLSFIEPTRDSDTVRAGVSLLFVRRGCIFYTSIEYNSYRIVISR